MEYNTNMPSGGENDWEKIKKQRFADYIGSLGFTKQEAEAFVNSNKDETERQKYVETLKGKVMFGKNISEFEANIIIDLSWDNLEDHEWIKKDEVITLIKEKGLNVETQTLVTNWKIEQEILAFKENTADANILATIEMTDFYIAAGDTMEAFKNLEDALEQADHQQNEALQNQVIMRLKAFRIEHNDVVEKFSSFKLLPTIPKGEIEPKE